MHYFWKLRSHQLIPRKQEFYSILSETHPSIDKSPFREDESGKRGLKWRRNHFNRVRLFGWVLQKDSQEWSQTWGKWINSVKNHATLKWIGSDEKEIRIGVAKF